MCSIKNSKMFDIEKKIKENLAFFNDSEPEKGHRGRFITRLSESDKSKKKIGVNFSLITKVAAIGLLVIALGFVLVNQLNTLKSENIMVTQIVYTDEFSEMQNYYDELSYSKLSEIDRIASNPDEAKRLKEKAEKKMEKLDASLSMIEKEYVKNPQCDKLKEAIIDNKKMKVKVVDNIVNQLANSQKGYHVGNEYLKF